MIKLFDPHISTESNAVSDVIKSKFWASGSGINQVEKFEKLFKNYTGCKECIAVNSGTAALNLSLSLYDLKNKQVLVPSLTFVSTVNSIVLNGGIPIFVDIDPETLCIDIEDVQKKITKNTKAIMPVHFAGMPSDLQKLRKISSNHNLLLFEDAAHAAGAYQKNKKIGSHSDAVCFSFHPVKNLAMPNGGAICLNDKNAKKNKKILNSLRWCGIDNRKGFSYDVNRLGSNYYMNEISAAIGLIQLKKLDRLNNIRKRFAKYYFQNIELENKMLYSNNCVYHFYWIRVKNRFKFMKKMKQSGIETGIHYKPVHKMSLYQKNVNLPITNQIENEIVSLPTHPNLTDNDIEKIVSCVNKFS
jgi:dTDP-4-amino-4,6-dideoxygalactose transaminase|tara:strand:+ start:12447 stop:13520 length:1074 start_codon:yes stop_codon:yes gene_type:complete